MRMVEYLYYIVN